ncbi:MarC family protein [Solimonas flava]|uniref:MarC family protein n=1 Tax=Solimonas flava TaxID=415849 RepID=UPI000416E9AC|nr:MarC family protein [Solimonas flava]
MTFLSAAVLLFLVMDPLGNVPLFLSALKNVPPERQRPVILREMLFALAILLIFLLGGGHMLRLLGLSQPALTVAGGVILMLIALRMIFPSREHSLEEDTAMAEPFLVPLAIPYVAGPSALATVLLMMSREPERWLTWIGAVLLAWCACLPIMLASTGLRNVLGTRGLTAVERLMGLLLVTIAVEMMMGGVVEFWTAHRP